MPLTWVARIRAACIEVILHTISKGMEPLVLFPFLVPTFRLLLIFNQASLNCLSAKYWLSVFCVLACVLHTSKCVYWINLLLCLFDPKKPTSSVLSCLTPHGHFPIYAHVIVHSLRLPNAGFFYTYPVSLHTYWNYKGSFVLIGVRIRELVKLWPIIKVTCLTLCQRREIPSEHAWSSVSR